MSGLGWYVRHGVVATPTALSELEAAGISPDIIWNGDAKSVAGGEETLIPAGPGPATLGNALDREKTVLNHATLSATYDFPGLADLLEVATAAEVQPGAGNVLWSFVMLVKAGVTPTGDIASNTDGSNGWRLAWAAGELVLLTQPGAVNVSIDSMGMAGLPVDQYVVCSFLRNDATNLLYVCDCRSERLLVNASAVAVPANDWDNTAKMTLGNGTAGGGAAGFAGWQCVGGFRWVGPQLDGFDGSSLVDHTRAVRSLTVGVFTVQQAFGAAVLENITDEIDAVQSKVVLGLNPAVVPIVMVGGARTGVDHLAIMEQSPGYKQTGIATLSGGYLLTLPPTFNGGYVLYDYRAQWTASGNTTMNVDSELGGGLTLIPPDLGTVLVTITSVQQTQGAVNEIDVIHVHSETVLPGLTLTGRIVYTSSSGTTITAIPGTFHVAWARIAE